VVGGEGSPVVELHVLPQLELPRGVVEEFPRGRERRPHLQLVVVLRELVEEVLQRRVGREGGEEVGIERVELELVAQGEVLPTRIQGEGKQQGGNEAPGHWIMFLSLSVPGLCPSPGSPSAGSCSNPTAIRP